jgi:RimJ/RimL family protein N-acetyltransferase
VHIRGYGDVESFSAKVEPWLLRREAEHNLLLGLLPTLRSGNHRFETPIYLSYVEIDREVAGCAFRTPPFKLGITRLPRESIPLLVEHVACVYTDLPAVMGPEEGAARFAELWSQRSSCGWSLGMRQRIHALEHVSFPDSRPSGSLRAAGDEDLPLLVEWMDAFARDTGTGGTDHRARCQELVRSASIFLWEDAEPRSMVAAPGTTPNGARVGYVYTPEAFRGRGYATIAVASLTDRLLRGGRRLCFLYTDLSNPTSNAIYARIGYRPVCDVVDANFSKPRSRPAA